MIGKIFRPGKAQLLGAVGAILLLIGGTVWVEAASQEAYEPEIPLGLDEDAFHVPEGNPMTKEKTIDSMLQETRTFKPSPEFSKKSY